MAVVKNLVEQGVINNAQNIGKNAGNKPLQGIGNYIETTGKKMQQKANTEIATNKYLDARRTDQTIGGYNYYLPNNQNSGPEWTSSQVTQGRMNGLVNTGAVAGIPQGPNYNIDLNSIGTGAPIQSPADTNTPVAQPTTQKGNGGTKQPSVSTPQTPQEPQTREPYADIVNGTGPIGVQKQEQPTNNMNEQAIINMQNDLATQGGKIYGKVSESNGNAINGINTINDPYGVEQITNQARIGNLKNLQTMSSYDIANSMVSGTTPYGDQAMRDLMQYNPEKYNEVQQYLKEQRGQENVNSIMSGGSINTTSQTKTNTDNVNNGITNRADSVTSNPEESSQVTTNIMNTMASNQVANTATQEMLNINKDLAELQNKLDNVQEEAKASFKGDVPQYLVDAKASNLRQKYQAEISKLESRYNSALDLYKTELNQAQWQEEMKLKYLQFQQNVSNDNWTRYYQSQQLLQNNIKRVDGVAYQIDPATGGYKQLTNTTAYDTYNQAVGSAMQGYKSMFYDGYQCGLQCESFTDNFTEATTGVRMEALDGSNRGYTYADEKLSYVNDFTPQVGSVVVAVGGAYDDTYGHTMLITGYDPNTGIMDLMWSNTNGDRTIHTSRTTMADIQKNSTAAGIWNPYLTAQSKSMNNYGTGGYTQYGVTITPMTSVFDEMIASGKNQDTVAKAEQSYTYLYEMVNDGSLNQLINSGDFGKIMAYMSKGNFGEKDDEGAKFSQRLKTYIEKKAAKELTGGDQSLQALNKLMQLVEVKLRKESGAAINSSEWLTNFEMFLPSAGESQEYQRDKMKSRDAIILRNLRSAGLPSVSQYIPIFGTQARQIRAY